MFKTTGSWYGSGWSSPANSRAQTKENHAPSSEGHERSTAVNVPHTPSGLGKSGHTFFDSPHKDTLTHRMSRWGAGGAAGTKR